VLGDLARLESEAATAHRDGCLAASGDLTALLASLHAAETCHLDLLVGAGLVGPGAIPTAAPPATAVQVSAPATTAAATDNGGGLAAMLAVEHAAVYAAATAGGALAPLGEVGAAAREFARGSYEAHRQRRDELTATIVAAGGEAPAAMPAYLLPIAPTDPTNALALLADVEDRCAAATHDAIAGLAVGPRSAAVTSLAGAAVRAQRIRLAVGLAPQTATRPVPGA
jgi:hypothetical protein